MSKWAFVYFVCSLLVSHALSLTLTEVFSTYGVNRTRSPSYTSASHIASSYTSKAGAFSFYFTSAAKTGNIMSDIYYATFGKPTQFRFDVTSPNPSMWTDTSQVVFLLENAIVLPDAACRDPSDVSKIYPTIVGPDANNITVIIGVPPSTADFNVLCTGLRNPTVDEAVAKNIPLNSVEVTVLATLDGVPITSVANNSQPITLSEFTTDVSADHKAVLETSMPLTFTLTTPNVDAVRIPEATVPLRIALTAAVFPLDTISDCATAAGTDVTVRKLDTLTTRSVEFDITKGMFTVGEDKQTVLTIICDVTFASALDLAVVNPLAGYARIFSEPVTGDVSDNRKTIHFASSTSSTVQYLPRTTTVIKIVIVAKHLPAALPDNAIAALTSVLSARTSALIAVATEVDNASTTCHLVTNEITQTTTATLPEYANKMTFACPVDCMAVANAAAAALEDPETDNASAFLDPLPKAVSPWCARASTVYMLYFNGESQDNTCFNGVVDANNNESDVDCGGVCPQCTAGKKCESDADCVQTCNPDTHTCVRVVRPGHNSAAHAAVGVAAVAVLASLLM